MNLILLDSAGQREYIFLIVMVRAQGTPYYLSTFQVSACIPPANIPLTKEKPKPKVMDRKVYSHGHFREGMNIFEQ